MDRLLPFDSAAMSLEGLATFAGLVSPGDTILELGAGFSTLYLRSRFGDRVHTCERNRRYLSLIREMCVDEGLYAGRFSSDLGECPRAACVLYDWDRTLARPAQMPAAWRLTEKVLYCDDADDRNSCRHYRRFIYRWSRNRADVERVEDCPQAKDRWGRWGVAVWKKANADHGLHEIGDDDGREDVWTQA